MIDVDQTIADARRGDGPSNLLPALIEAATQRDAALAVIAATLAIGRSGSVPLGQTEARHFDRLIAAMRSCLLEIPTNTLDARDREQRRAGVLAYADHLDEQAEALLGRRVSSQRSLDVREWARQEFGS